MSLDSGNREWYFHSPVYVFIDYVSVALVDLELSLCSLCEDCHDYLLSPGSFLM